MVIKRIKKKPNRPNFVFLISLLENIQSLKFLCLPPIIMGVYCGEDTKILMIQFFLVEI